MRSPPLLICIGLAAGYFIYKANSTTEANQTPVIEQQIVADNAQPETALEAPTPEISDSHLSENIEQAEVKPASMKTTVEKRTDVQKQKIVDEPVDDEIERTESAKPASVKAETSRPAPVQSKRRNGSQRSGEIRSRVVEPQSAPDIESIFTGRSAAQRDEIQQRREERQRQREQMSDEELREMRRQRKQERKRRQDSQPLPF